MTTKIKLINPAVTPTVAGIVATSVSQFTDVNIPDNNAVRFGSSQDLQIYHDGTNSYVKEEGPGALVLQSNGTAIVLEKTDGENMILANTDGDVKLYYNGSEKLATDSAGINVTGGIDVADITATGNVNLNSDNGTLYFGAGADLRIYHNGSNSYIDEVGTGALNIRSSGIYLEKFDGSEVMASFLADGATSLMHNGSTKLATSTAGATVTGTLTVTGDLDITGNVNSTSVTDLDVTDKTITVGAGQTEAASGGSGLIVDGSNASILWDETSDEWDFNKSVSIVDTGGANLFLNDSNGRTIRLRTANSGSQNSNISSYAGLYLGGSDNANHMLINGSGNVKIGSSTVSGARLSVTGTSSGSNNPGIFQIGTDTTMGTGTNMMTMGVDNDSHVWIQGTKPGYDSRNIVLQPGGLVNSNAYVGIGVTDPSAALHIQTATSDTNSAVPSIMITNLSSGTTTTGFGGEIRFQAQRNSGVNQNTGGIRSVAEVNAGTNISSGLAFDVGTAGVNDEALRIKYNGNVGIGTNDPAAALEVARGSAGYVAMFGAPQGSGKVILFKDNHASPNKYNWLVGTQYNTNNAFEITPSTVVGGYTFNAPAITVLETGNVGIGTNNPSSPLHVSAAKNDGWLAQLHNTGTGSDANGLDIHAGVDSSDYILRTRHQDGTDAMTVKYGGKVGIGETSPLGKLHIKEADSGQGSVNVNFDQLVLEHNSHSGMTILSGTSSDGGIYFGDSGGNNLGQFKYKHGSNSFAFVTNNGNESFIIDANGKGIHERNVNGSGSIDYANMLEIRRVGGATSNNQREAAISFFDSANSTYTAMITGVRTSPAGNYDGGLSIYTNSHSQNANATSISEMVSGKVVHFGANQNTTFYGGISVTASSALIVGGFGANSTGGTLDWNHATNARSGMGNTLLLGNATNGPGGNLYYHVVNYEYTTKNGTGNMTQHAIPYYGAATIYSRNRYQGTWSSWGTV